jgi:hypothetical protein
MEVEWLIIADAAQVVGGKLYLLGGGYDRVTLPKGPPAPHSMAVAVAFRVPWTETNMKHDFDVEILDGDGHKIFGGSGQFEVGRAHGIAPGQDQRTQLAMNIGWQVENLGTYEAVARVVGAERRFPFYVVASGGT